MADINFQHIEKKWQDKWEKGKCFEVKEKGKKFYCLEMFPYPSSSGLHVGHAFNYIIGDIYSRFKMMQGFNVLHPMGYDSLGLPAENAAIKEGIHPMKYTDNSVANFMRQQKALGLSYDWTRFVNTCKPDYYKWDQWIFLKMFEKGIAYRKKSAVNWCPKCNSVLANEQVHNGKCWRHEDTDVEIKHLEQWYFKITDYVDELNDFSKLKYWPELIKKLQENWIGKSHGVEIDFSINGKKWPIFTTRPDTIYGVTFMVISAQHERLMEIVTDKQLKEVENFLKRLKSVSEKELEEMEKEGVFTGSYAINPLTNEKVPVYAGNFVLADYGCGMVMAVPCHDERDFQFAKKYKIPIKVVIQNKNNSLSEKTMQHSYTDEGILVNSGQFSGLNSKKAIEDISNYVQNKKLGKKAINYKLRDWLISRQRYWGTPIPIIYCDKCGAVPVNEKDLPVKLPEKVKFGKGNPLESAEDWVNVKCPKCKGKAKRETDTMDTFVNSSWYYLRYCDAKNNKKIFDEKKVKYWVPVDLYIGGKEHACMHLIYIRFYTKFLRDLGLIKLDEPAIRLFNQGYIYGEDGRKMSKSYGNVIDPLDTSKRYSVDGLRLYAVSVASPESDFNWSEKGIEGSARFVNKILNYFKNCKFGKSGKKIESKLNKSIKEITEDIENIRYNIAIIRLRELFEKISESEISKEDFKKFLRLLTPFCPHIAEELWEKIGNKPFISLAEWPKADEKKIDLNLEKQEQQVEKLADDINNILKIIREKGKNAKKAYVYCIPNEKEIYFNEIETIKKKTNLDIEVFAVNDKKKHDPKGIAKKSKPGRPGIYVE